MFEPVGDTAVQWTYKNSWSVTLPLYNPEFGGNRPHSLTHCSPAVTYPRTEETCESSLI